MPVIASSDFSGFAHAQELSVAIPDFIRIDGFAEAFIDAEAGRSGVFTNAITLAAYYHAAVPTTPHYRVRGPAYRLTGATSTPKVALLAHHIVGEPTFYALVTNLLSTLVIQKYRLGQSVETLGSVSLTVPIGDARDLDLEIETVGATVRLTPRVVGALTAMGTGGVVTDSGTPSNPPITAAGRGGLAVQELREIGVANVGGLGSWELETIVPAGPVITGNITTDSAAPTGTLQSNPPSTLTGAIAVDSATPTGGLSSGAAPGTVVLIGWDNLAGMPLPSTPVARITMQRLSDGVQVLNLPGLTTSADPATPVISITNAALVAGTFYLAIANNADGTVLGVERVQAV